MRAMWQAVSSVVSLPGVAGGSILLGQPHDQITCSIATCGKRYMLAGHLPTVVQM